MDNNENITTLCQVPCLAVSFENPLKLVEYLSFFVLFVCISLLLNINTALAHYDPHDGSENATTAKDVIQATAADRGEKLRNFVKHASLHLSGSSSFTESLNLLNSFRNEGQWRSGSVYLILLTKAGGIYVHPGNRNLEDEDWSKKLTGCNGESWRELLGKGNGGCVKYVGQDGKVPTGYALPTSGQFVPFSNPDSYEGKEFVLVGGLDYSPEPEDSHPTFNDLKQSVISSFLDRTPSIRDNPAECANIFSTGQSDADNPAECAELIAKRLDQAITPEINASDVHTQGHLQDFLRNAIRLIVASSQLELLDPVILRRIFRYEGGPWRSGSTYIYIMDDEGNVVFNGANRNIEQTDLWNFEGQEGEEQTDDERNCQSEDYSYEFFIRRIIRVAKCKPEGGFVLYNWDNPRIVGDEPADPDTAGGGSSKLGYAVEFNQGGCENSSTSSCRTYIFGTGLYFSQEEEVDDDGRGSGCSLAGGEATFGNLASSLLLIFLLLVSAVLLKDASGWFSRKSRQ